MEPKFQDDDNSMHPRDIPFDLITQNILIRLPIKPLVRFKSVSKQWYSTISSPQFGHTHLKFQRTSPLESLLIRINEQLSVFSYENEEMSLMNMDAGFNIVLVGSCNGLVCLGSTSGYYFVICNPVTGEFRKYSDSEIVDFSPEDYMVTWGFGYVSDVDDYKVVRICKKEFKRSFAVHVFSTRFDKWRRVDNDTSHRTPNYYGLKIAEYLHLPGVLVNETLYWMGVPSMERLMPRKIFSFDLALELFDTFPHLDVCPPWKNVIGENGECLDLFLCVVKGCLSKYGRLVRSGEGLITVLKHVGETEEILLSRELIDSTCGNLIECRKNDVFFTQYYDSGRCAYSLGIISGISSPMVHKHLIAFKNVQKIQMISYSSSLISPLWLQGRTSSIQSHPLQLSPPDNYRIRASSI